MERRTRGDRLQEARLANGRADRRRLQLPVDVRSRHRRRLLRHRRQDHEARVDAASGRRLRAVHPTAAGTGQGGRLLLARRRREHERCAHRVRAGLRPGQREAALGQPVPVLPGCEHDGGSTPRRCVHGRLRHVPDGRAEDQAGSPVREELEQVVHGTERERRVLLQLLERCLGARPGAEQVGRSHRRGAAGGAAPDAPAGLPGRQQGHPEARQSPSGDSGPVPAADHEGRGIRDGDDRRSPGYVPNVDQTFGGYFGPNKPAPGRNYPACVKRKLPWQGKIKVVKNGVITNQVIK